MPVMAAITSSSAQTQSPADVPQSDNRSSAANLLTQGNALLNQRTPESIHKAIIVFEQAFVLSQSLKAPALEAQADSGLAFAHLALNETSEALTLETKALDLARTAGDKGLEAGCLVSLGLIYDRAGDRSKALESYRQGRIIWQLTGNPLAEAQVFNLEGFTYAKQKDLPHAIAAYEQSLALFREAKANRISRRNSSCLVRPTARSSSPKTF